MSHTLKGGTHTERRNHISQLSVSSRQENSVLKTAAQRKTLNPTFAPEKLS